MLPKAEKLKKDSKSEQLDFVQGLDSQQKVVKNRRLVIIFLIFTVGLSLLFWTYRGLVSFLRQPNLSFPFLSKTSNPSTPDPSPDISSLIESRLLAEDQIWSVYIQIIPDPVALYSRNTDDLFSRQNPSQIIGELRQITVSETGLIKDAMPPGAEVRELIVDNPAFYSVSALIKVPTAELLMIFKVTGSGDLKTAHQMIPDLTSDIYWKIITSI